ncbi:hypothetical protein KWO_013885 [Xanthomonas vasicola pv. musacearum NCPPB 4379]|nr:hypothetical protein KWO_013885 [Xanthomonas vasicola pv. musacearum NCPPB 4379]RJL88044.1 hypothetical protein DEG03_001795 [Xanthomonas vasicola]RJN31010.1 hypothetical protein DEF94_001790 [Xanthomonas vasicola]
MHGAERGIIRSRFFWPGNRESGIGNRESGIGNRESGIEKACGCASAGVYKALPRRYFAPALH